MNVYGWVDLAGMVGIIAGTELVLAALSRRYRMKKWAKEVLPFIKTTTRFVVLFVVVGLFLQWLGYDVSKFFIGTSGLIGLIIGFGFKDFISNFAAGVWIMVVDPFDVGDVITVKGVIGRVEYVTALTTIIRTDDGNVVYVPNQNVWGNVISVKREGGDS